MPLGYPLFITPKDLSDRGLRVYECKGYEDALLLNWWADMARSGDADKTFGNYSLGTFYELFRPNNILIYGVEKDGEKPYIWFACWYSPLMENTYISVYVHEKFRFTRKAYEALQYSMYFGYSIFHNMLMLTKNQDMLKLWEKLGAVVSPALDGFFDGHDGWLGILTKKVYMAGRMNPYREKRNGNDGSSDV